MPTTEDLRAALNYPGPESAPAPAALIARGRRRRAARRAVLGSTVTAVAAVAAVAAGTQLGGGPGAPRPTPPGAVDSLPDPVLVAAASPAPAGAPARFDPLQRTLHVGWIPPGLKDQMAETTPWAQAYAGFDVHYRNGGPDLGLFVQVLAAGRPVTDLAVGALGLPVDAVARRTAPIHGRPAECLLAPPAGTVAPPAGRSPAPRDGQAPASTGSCPALRWQYAPGAWAQVSYAGAARRTPAESDAVTRRVAESVRLAAAQPVRLPFRLTGPLAALHPSRTLVDVYQQGTGSDGERWSASVDLVADPGEVTAGYDDQHAVTVGALHRPDDPSGRTARDGQIAPPNTTVDGHRAWLRSDGGALIVWGVRGTRLSVEYRRPPGSARAGYAAVRVLPAPADPARWLPAR